MLAEDLQGIRCIRRINVVYGCRTDVGNAGVGVAHVERQFSDAISGIDRDCTWQIARPG